VIRFILKAGAARGLPIVCMLSASDALEPPVAGLQKTEWRGFFEVDGRLATVAVRGIAEDPLADRDGRALLERTITAVQLANVAG